MYGHYGFVPYSVVGQEYDPAPPRLQAYEKHAQQQVTAAVAYRPASDQRSYFLWILDADGREYIIPFATAAEMGATMRRKNLNFYYAVLFDKTSPVWPKPNASGYGCHAPEWNTWPSEFPAKQVPCPSTVSGWPWWPAVGQSVSEAHLAAAQPASRSVAEAHLAAAKPADVFPLLTRETDERFWRQTRYKPGQKLDMSNPTDRKMAMVWLDIYEKAQADFAAGRPMHSVVAARAAAIRAALHRLGVGGQCGVRSYASVTPQIINTILAKLRAEGLGVTGDNPWDIDTHQYDVKLRAVWDPRTQVLKLIVTAGQGAYFGLVTCDAIWKQIDPFMR